MKVRSVTILQLRDPQQAINVISQLSSFINTTITALGKMADGDPEAPEFNPHNVKGVLQALGKKHTEVMKSCSVDLSDEDVAKLKEITESMKGMPREAVDEAVRAAAEELNLDIRLAAVPVPSEPEAAAGKFMHTAPKTVQ